MFFFTDLSQHDVVWQDLEAERTKLMTEVAANKRKMKELEDNLLYHLTSTTGSLVEDETLIEALTVTKETAHEVNEKLSIAAENEVRINSAREEFRPGRSDRYSADQRFGLRSHTVLSIPHDVSNECCW